MVFEDIIAKMTLEEKVAFFSGKDFWQTADNARLGIPSAFLADGPSGVRKQRAAADHLGLNPSYPSTCFPSSATMANSWDIDLEREVGAAIGEEAASLKVNVLLGPGVNIKRSPLCGRNFEYFSEDPYLSGKMASAYINGVQSNGVSACVKHFAGNNQEYRRLVIDSVIDERTLREIYLTAFEIAIKEGGAKTIMSAYNRLNGEFANENKHLLVDILRDEFGYNGVVVTDWGGENDRVKGFKCGNELEMPGGDGTTNNEILQAVKNGLIKEQAIDEALDRLLNLIITTRDAIKEDKTFNIEEHHNIVEKASENSIVLLKNNKKALPLKANEKIAIIGSFAEKPRFQGAGSSVVNPTKVDTTLELVKGYNLDYIGFATGYNRYGKSSKSLIKKAIKLSQNADTLLVYIGLDEVSEAEGVDRKGMKLPKNQLELLSELTKLNKKIVVVLSCGSPVEMDFVENVNAIIHGYLGGQAGAKAMLNALCGKVNPSGKLAESYPICYEDCSSSSYFPGNDATVEYREGLFVGYRYFDTVGMQTRFPFGFGLSYTTFRYSDIKVNAKGVTFSIENTGDQNGQEVCQVYVGLENSKIVRPKKELKAFKKVYLKAGEKQEVSIMFDDYTFRYFDIKLDSWKIEQGEYSVFVGASCQDIRLTGKIFVKGYVIETDRKAMFPSFSTGKIERVKDDEFSKLLGRQIPRSTLKFYKKNRIVVDYNTTILELRYSKRWIGRFFSWGVRFGYNFMKLIGNHTTANLIQMSFYHQPMRGLSRMTGGAITWGQLDGIIMMFNGKFFKGLNKFFAEGKKKKIAKKLAKKQQKMLEKNKEVKK